MQPLYLEVARPGSYRLVMQAGSFCRVTPSRRFTAQIEEVVGRDCVRYRARPNKKPPQVRT